MNKGSDGRRDPGKEGVLNVRTATVTIRDGAWWLSVEGTDINRKIWDSSAVRPGYFPGNEMGHRLIEDGFMPDRSASHPRNYETDEEKLAAAVMAGWIRTGDGEWQIPCTRR